jgi:Zn-dependent peptidase ImmA (M78 family)/DNA-binding XRE family transcriptional regulator
MKTNSDLHFQGQRLRLARTFHGLTLAELGEQVTASRQYIQRLEGDPDTSPSEEMLLALADALRVEPDFFFEPILGEIAENECHFRKLKTTPVNLRTRALSYGTIFNFILGYLEECLDLPPVNIPQIKADHREDIERAAEKCRRQWRLRLDAPINNMTRTLERFGCVVTTFKGVSEKIDAFSYYRSRPIIVRSLDKGSSSRARFDLAHECGHLVMHYDVEVGDPALEEQANQFASAFLLPRVAFVHEFPRSRRLDWRGIFRLKKRWGVSVQAIIRRAYDLRLIDAVQYRNANIHISRNGWRHGEPPETEPPVEPTEILPTAFEIISKEHNMEAVDVAQSLYVHCAILREFGISCEERQDITEKNNVIYFRGRKKRPK